MSERIVDLPTHRVRVRVDGAVDKPWLLFCNSLGTDLHMWDAQVEALGEQFRILRYDRRGHGGSEAPPAPYALADLGGDVLALLDAFGIEHVNFCGLSIGGLVGQWLGIHADERLQRLVVCTTAAKIGTHESWHARIAQVRAEGLHGLTAATAERWFTPAFVAHAPVAVQRILDTFATTSVEGYVGCCAALADADLRADLARIRVPVLAISGDEDPVCPPSDLQAIADGVADGRHVSVHGRHICNIESAEAFNRTLAGFLSAQDRAS